MLTVIDEYTRECRAIGVDRHIRSGDVLHVLSDLFTQRRAPDHVRSDHGSEFTATALREWLPRVGVKTLCMEPGSPWENGDNGSFSGKLGDELLNREIVSSMTEAKVLIEQWRRHYNTVRPHHRPSCLTATIRPPLTGGRRRLAAQQTVSTKR